MPTTNDVPNDERRIYEQLKVIRAELSQLKQDRTQYLNSKDITSQYDKLLALAKELHYLRKAKGGNTMGNKVDQVFDDVFQILSLLFITVGLVKAVPATYASLTTVQRLLEHLNESRVYTQNDLNPIRERLTEIKQIISETHGDGQLDEDYLIRSKLDNCLKEFKQVESKIEQIDPELNSFFEKLVFIRRQLLSVASKNLNDVDDVKKEIEPLKQKLTDLSLNRDGNGHFKSLETGKVKENGQNVLNGLLDDCNTLIGDLLVSNFRINVELNPIYEKLMTLKCQLEDLLVTRRWTLRETDLYTYQKTLQEIDDLRVDGKFPIANPSENKELDSRNQSVLLYLLRRNYAIIYKLLESSEPVSEALQLIHNQLSTVRGCLLEVKRMGGVNNPRELYPYQMKLGSLDNLRVDGKFYVDGNIPEGQGTLNALLAECYDICFELKVEADQRAEDKSEAEEAPDEENLYDNDFADEDGDYEIEDEEEEDEDADYPPSYAPSMVEGEVPGTQA